MIKEIRQKSKSLREAEEKVETLKKREVQIRETCDAWKKEVFYSVQYFTVVTQLDTVGIAACSAK